MALQCVIGSQGCFQSVHDVMCVGLTHLRRSVAKKGSITELMIADRNNNKHLFVGKVCIALCYALQSVQQAPRLPLTASCGSDYRAAPDSPIARQRAHDAASPRDEVRQFIPQNRCLRVYDLKALRSSTTSCTRLMKENELRPQVHPNLIAPLL